jgi:hypothetical protein
MNLKNNKKIYDNGENARYAIILSLIALSRYEKASEPKEDMAAIEWLGLNNR